VDDLGHEGASGNLEGAGDLNLKENKMTEKKDVDDIERPFNQVHRWTDLDNIKGQPIQEGTVLPLDVEDLALVIHPDGEVMFYLPNTENYDGLNVTQQAAMAGVIQYLAGIIKCNFLEMEKLISVDGES
jgi:hypothetical protein